MRTDLPRSVGARADSMRPVGVGRVASFISSSTRRAEFRKSAAAEAASRRAATASWGGLKVGGFRILNRTRRGKLNDCVSSP